MSTPSTLPPHHPNYGYSHHQNYQSNNPYRASNNLLNGSGRLGVSYTNPTNSSSNSTSSSIGPLAKTTQIPSHPAKKPSTNSPQKSTAMVSSASQAPPPHKRQRSKERQPDWDKFYENGLPKEVIVIDSSESPEPSLDVSSHIQTNNSAVAANSRHAAKKRKRNDAYDPVYQLDPSIDPSPQYKSESGSNSTISTDRTTSAIHTTAATSLGSHSSNGQNGYEAAELTGQKRKRTNTRLQLANEAKRKELEVNGDAFSNYIPPPKPPIKSRDVPVRQVLDHSYAKNSKVDDEDGHYIVVPDTNLTTQYSVLKLLGQGTFGKVVQAKDHLDNGKLVAIKIIRSVQKYRDASKIELRVLSTLKANDHENRNRFMDLLGQSVFDFLKGNSFVPFPNSQIQSFARQLFTSVAFLHDLNLIHTDLKPENILLCNSAYQAFTYSRKIPSSSTTVSRQAAQRKVLLDTEIRLIDFGSATFQDEYHSSVVSTRHYRAPEIILGLGWSFPCDIWSIGCILVEFFTGDALFQTHDNLEHLAMMEMVCDKKLDSHLIQQVNAMAKRNGGNPAQKYFRRLKLDYPTADTTRASRRFVKAMKSLDEIIKDQGRFSRNFLDLLKRIFVYDPSERITAKQALQHPWFKEAAIADDGTEATKIRLQRQSGTYTAPQRQHH
ncbi:hypothetical protein EYC80_002634 [Monilinia laxa]|uniref:dual-specificity kinase n=1 Tax=Monilinia laxa TaxID=61186 RepID=A0A5N6K5A3_MONLA|nr:hypothetical protein EYC80_002634 [Monilinia laxa]